MMTTTAAMQLFVICRYTELSRSIRAAKTPDLETFNRSLELTAPQEQLFSLQLTRIARYGRFPSPLICCHGSVKCLQH